MWFHCNVVALSCQAYQLLVPDMLRSSILTHWGRVTHICVVKLIINGSDNGLSPGRRQAIIWTNAALSLIGPLGTNFSEILIEILTFSFRKLHLKVSSAKWRLFCLSLNELSVNSSSTGAVWMKDCHYALGHHCACWWPSTMWCQAISRHSVDYEVSMIFSSDSLTTFE